MLIFKICNFILRFKIGVLIDFLEASNNLGRIGLFDLPILAYNWIILLEAPRIAYEQSIRHSADWACHFQ